MRVHYDNTSKEEILDKINSLACLHFNEEEFVAKVDNINQIINQSNNIVVIGSTYPEMLCLHYMEDMIMLDKMVYSIPQGGGEPDLNSVVIMISLTGRLYAERYNDIKRINDLNVPIIGISNVNTLPKSIHVKEYLELPFSGDNEIENSVIPLVMQYIKYDYIEKYHKGVI